MNPLTSFLRSRSAAGLPVFDLTESNPTQCGFDYGGEKLLDAFLDPRAMRYEPDPRGLASARAAVVQYYAGQGVDIDPSQVFLTSSTSEAYSFIFRLLGNPGEEVLIPRPSYPLFEFLAGLNDLRLAPYPLAYDAAWRLDQDALREAATRRAKAVLVVHPNNPTGSYASAEEAAFLDAFCEEREMALIADEVFFDYAHPRVPALRAPTFAGEQRSLTFTLNGLSKISGLPQMKCAWIVASGPAKLLDEALGRLELIADTFLSLSTPVACALPQLLEVRRRIQPQILDRVTENLRLLDSMLVPESPVSRLNIEGGWCAILRVPRIYSDEEWALKLLREDGVFLHPGHFYDFPSDGRLVISLLPQPEVFGEACNRLLVRAAKGA
ncbi:MAG: pyridoxal phosphate-dependent aminotransferase [Acidobacteriota bacterium]|nr:pyridoxal phosphate-dependent aminotransferase [Acidobacteriota bacterium]